MPVCPDMSAHPIFVYSLKVISYCYCFRIFIFFKFQADSSLVKGKEDSFIGKLWNSIFSSGGDNSASTNTD
ncbi:unnamed protein product [Meloidogyne enterolobii]|uniref:Uncharacterized protein n=1 Tax=Meloidogyne enterolobii TaxID=390850 RepID=A0ACB0YWZ3_MELEN